MSQITITVLGLSAIKISNGSETVYVDAFFKDHPIAVFDGSDATIILVTHDHGDHFSAEETAAAAHKANAIVVGPPSIAYPLLVTHSLPAEQLRILYHQDPHTPVGTQIDGVRIHAYSSQHFSDGDNMTIHNSYLLEFGGKKIFLTGDSNTISKKARQLMNLDALVYNFVVPDKDLSKVSDLEDAMNTFSPKLLIPVHIVACDWTIQPADLSREIARRNLKSIPVLQEGYTSQII